jgi:hypothetical protein
MFGIVNEILGDHNVDKQMTDSRGDVSTRISENRKITERSHLLIKYDQVAYLMADISDVNSTQIKELYQSLESLSCKIHPYGALLLITLQRTNHTNELHSSNHDPHSVLDGASPKGNALL